jgi:hypothetical protein
VSRNSTSSSGRLTLTFIPKCHLASYSGSNEMSSLRTAGRRSRFLSGEVSNSGIRGTTADMVLDAGTTS